MRYGVLGPLQVSDDGRPIDIAGSKQRALLAMLLLHANRVVSTDRLIDALWGETPPRPRPRRSRSTCRSCASCSAAERVETRAPGYLLQVADGELDLERFQPAARRRASSHEALALWRGPPLADFASSASPRREIARLEELRLAASRSASTPTCGGPARRPSSASSRRSSPSTRCASGCAAS